MAHRDFVSGLRRPSKPSEAAQQDQAVKCRRISYREDEKPAAFDSAVSIDQLLPAELPSLHRDSSRPRSEIARTPTPTLTAPTSLVEPTQQDTAAKGSFEELLQQHKNTLSLDDVRCFHFAPLTPPISVQALSELDISRAFDNPSLRHDINFERDIHFRPNDAGDKYMRRQEEAARYWRAIRVELDLYAFLLRDPRMQEHRWSQPWLKEFSKRRRPRVRRMLEMIQELVLWLTVMNIEDRICVCDTLHVDTLMQRLERDVLDLAGLMEWLAALLKEHCAPMRDNDIDAWSSQARQGSETFDVSLIVRSFQGLFSTFEVMKLDIANHQIRNLRPSLIDSSIVYEQTYFAYQVSRGAIETQEARQWYETHVAAAASDAEPDHAQSLAAPTADSSHPSPAFLHAVINMLFDPTYKVPETFKLDTQRLHNLRQAIQETIRLDVCATGLRKLIASTPRRSDLASTNNNPAGNVWARAKSLVDTYVKSNLVSSSKPSTPSSASSTPSPPTSTTDPITNTFTSLIPTLVAEIIRNATCTSSNSTTPSKSYMTQPMQAWLTKHLESTSSTFLGCETLLRQLLLDHVSETVNQLKGKGLLAVLEALVPRNGMTTPPIAAKETLNAAEGSTAAVPVHMSTGRSIVPHTTHPLHPAAVSSGGMDDAFDVDSRIALHYSRDSVVANLASRIAHVALIHWRVWAPLLYANGASAVAEFK